MSTCFVIQPFDGGEFDNRYEDVLVPAITNADVEPYRVDRDPNVTIPIDEIQNGIKNAEVVLADITLDNPNVWFELGYAIASRKEVVLICSDQRSTNFPFDIQHRKIITYSNGSLRDFEKLKIEIAERLKAIIKKQYNMGLISTQSLIAKTEGLAPHEMTLLVSIAQNLFDPSGYVNAYTIRQDMSKAGFSPIAVTLGLDSLLTKGFIMSREERDYDGDIFTAYSLLDEGKAWLHSNIDKLDLRQEQTAAANENDSFDDGLPF